MSGVHFKLSLLYYDVVGGDTDHGSMDFLR
jgi:hypothetical protein